MKNFNHLKKLCLTLLILPFLSVNGTISDELKSVNKFWSLNADGARLAASLKEKPHADPIISHLILVEKILRERPTTHLSAVQKQNRNKYLDILKKYSLIATVPVNDYIPVRTPVFVDRIGTHCAVGFLMQQGEHEELAQKINNTQKFAYIHDIRIEGLEQWQHESGLTLDELAWIQPGYPFSSYAESIGEGLNGEVLDIVKYSSRYSFLAAGSFTIGNNASPVVLAGFDGQNWVSIISSTGVINKLEIQSEKVICYGGNLNFGNVQDGEIIEADLSPLKATFKVLGNLDGEVFGYEYFKGKKYICGNFTGGIAVQSDLGWDGISTYITKAWFKYPRSLKTYGDNLYVAGDVLNPGYGYQLTKYDGQSFTPVSGNVVDFTVHLQNCLNVYENKLLIGVQAPFQTDSLLYSYDEEELTMNLFGIYSQLYGTEVKTIVSDGNHLALSGKFSCGMMSVGNGFAFYEPDFEYFYPKILVVGHINTAIVENENKIIIGGNFDKFYSGSGQFGGPYDVAPLYSVGVITEPPSSVDPTPNKRNNFGIYPNPSSGIYAIAGHSGISKIHVLNPQGQSIINCYSPSEKSINLSSFANGVYMVEIYSDEGEKEMIRVVKN